MPTVGNITPASRRCLENMLVAGPCNVLELNALDPSAPDHRQTIKNLEQAKYVVVHDYTNKNTLAHYSLTDKARRLLAGRDLERAAPQPKATTAAPARRYATPKGARITPPVSHGSMTTGRLHQSNADMLAPATRAGAEQALRLPSRVNDMLHYRDGRRVQINATRSA